MRDDGDAFADDVPADDARRRRLAALLDPQHEPGDGESRPDATRIGWTATRGRLERVCAVAVDVVGVDGAGVTVMAGAEAALAGHRDQLASTGSKSRRLEDLQLTAGEGPCLDAYRTGAPVLVADLAAEPARWLGFGPEAIAAEVAAVFSLPLQVGAIRLGTLDLHRRTAGPLTRKQQADALALASLATEALLELADLADTADTGIDGSSHLGIESRTGWLPDVHADVHVAAGMVSAQTGTDVRSALLRLRAYAFARSEPLYDVARRIVERTLTFPRAENDGPSPGPTRPDEEGEP